MKVTLFLSIMDVDWDDSFLKNGITPKDIGYQHSAGDNTNVLLVTRVPFYECMIQNVEVMFRNDITQIYKDPDEDDKDREGGCYYWGYYVLDIKPEEIIKTMPSGYLVARNQEDGRVDEFPFVGQHYLDAKALPERWRIWTLECQVESDELK
jgi:hypothetical protein